MSSHTHNKQHAPNKTIKFVTSFNNTIRDVFLSKRWTDVTQAVDCLYPTNAQITTPDIDWDITWADREHIFEIFDRSKLLNHQRINHFRNSRELCRKDLLIKNLKRRKRQLEKQGDWEELKRFNFFPVTFTLPNDYSLFVELFAEVYSALKASRSSLFRTIWARHNDR